VGVENFEIIWNGEIVAKHILTGTKKTADVTGQIKITVVG
jgi:hypothetical protein